MKHFETPRTNVLLEFAPGPSTQLHTRGHSVPFWPFLHAYTSHAQSHHARRGSSKRFLKGLCAAQAPCCTGTVLPAESPPNTS